MKTPLLSCTLALVSLWQAHSASAPKYLEPWKPGVLDIHHINAGTGETTYFVMPDGTTMLVDTGIHGRPFNERSAKPVPNGSKGPGEWVARYISQLHGKPSVNIDYTVATHFDEDHIGGIVEGLQESKAGGYLLTGLSEVLDHHTTSKILDRGYPSYDYPKPLESKHIVNYRKFVEFQVNQGTSKAERFQAGRHDQIALIREPQKYPQFRIQNLAVNGEVWTGQGSESKAHFPPLESLAGKRLPSENASSLAFKVTYGDFDYFTGGDILGVPPKGMPEWADIETPVAKVTGPVEALVANHHAYVDSMNETFLKTLAPQVQIILSWDNNHPHVDTFPRMISDSLFEGPKDIFITNLIPLAEEKLGPENAAKFKSKQGHVVIRVAEDGKSYHVHVLNDQSEDRFILASFGPYLSR